ncbi:GNAT family N-acetyltransferase [Parvibium lacunae]|uniref:N-acetyltransferase n=1 Tax=Parvibium lacunae TaxID=1888893 RepID=A0A368L3H5_9BURK|nr:GNAT family N-acetyltransferase [Parvibium lacunae]RCS58141.1 N-acetyltransferase [Parvibium lacunae]
MQTPSDITPTGAAASPYEIKWLNTISDCPATSWNALLHPKHTDMGGQVFARHEFLAALETAGCVSRQTGWQPRHLTVWEPATENQAARLVAACPLYLKTHSYGEFVFDWSWAEAYQRHSLAYYPKLLCAVPFTPVRGPRLLAETPALQALLISTLQTAVRELGLSSLHLLFPPNAQTSPLSEAGWALRTSVQFHWQNQGFAHFEDYLQGLTQKKRKNIRQERRYAAQHGLQYQHLSGAEMREQDWADFYACYAHTYHVRGNPPYLNQAFFTLLGQHLPEHVQVIFATDPQQSQRRVAAVFLMVDHTLDTPTAYGRYWGALGDYPYLHFELAYYQSIEYCIRHGIQRFEGGAQGEHKMARGFMPEPLLSGHWMAHPGFHEAVADFVAAETKGMQHYLDELAEHSPLNHSSLTLRVA